MRHLDEPYLHEYADDALDAEERAMVEAHLAACAECRATLLEIQTLFTELETLADVPLTTDLSQRVLAQIEPAPARRSWPAFLLLLQIMAAGVMLALLWPTIQALLALSGRTATAVLANWSWPQLQGWGTSLARGAALFSQLRPWELPFNLALSQWAMLLGLALILWLAGNRLIFVEQLTPQGDRNE